jgi:hypothetical protein
MARRSACTSRACRSGDGRGEPASQGGQTPHEVSHHLCPRRIGASVAGVDDDVDTLVDQSLTVAPEQLADAPPRPVAHDRAAETPRRGDAEAALTTVSQQRKDDNVATTDLNTLPVDRLKLAPPA